jgi:hypothetical protein
MMIARPKRTNWLCWTVAGLLICIVAAVLALESQSQAQREQVLAVPITAKPAPAKKWANVKRASPPSVSQSGDARPHSAAASLTPAGRGGAAQADFDSLIELITSTVRPSSWIDLGGPGAIKPFPMGVWLDLRGTFPSLTLPKSDNQLTALRSTAQPHAESQDPRRSSPLRMVSLPRLEKCIRQRLSAGQPLTDAMQNLAGLYAVRYVFLYPDTGDIVLAGPAGDWIPGQGTVPIFQAPSRSDGREKWDCPPSPLNKQTARPILQLDDMAVLFPRMMSRSDANYGCLIAPREANLARLQAFLQQSQSRSLAPESRRTWLGQIRSKVGRQDVEVFGLDPHTRAAHIIVEADYHMKLIGMGLKPGVPGVVSYLNSIPTGKTPPPMTVLRWWFTLGNEPVLCSANRLAFRIPDKMVRLQSENELLTAEGRQIHTGVSEELNRRFAHSFTEHFEEISLKYPIYAEMRNLFVLSLVGALIREESALETVGWNSTGLTVPDAIPVEQTTPTKEVDSIVNARTLNSKTLIAGVSGGVQVRPASLIRRQSIRIDPTLKNPRPAVVPNNGNWWWDEIIQPQSGDLR